MLNFLNESLFSVGGEMAKQGKPEKRNATYQRLEGLPFKYASDLNKAEDKIKHEVWRRLTEARFFDEYVENREEFARTKSELKKGLTCYYGENGEALVKVFSPGPGEGLHCEIDPTFASSIGKNDHKMFESLVRAACDSFGNLYLRTKGLLNSGESTPELVIKGK